MRNELTIMLTKLLLAIGLITGATGELLDQIDLILGMILKTLSIISFVIVITINWSKFITTIKDWLK